MEKLRKILCHNVIGKVVYFILYCMLYISTDIMMEHTVKHSLNEKSFFPIIIVILSFIMIEFFRFSVDSKKSVSICSIVYLVVALIVMTIRRTFADIPKQYMVYSILPYLSILLLWFVSYMTFPNNVEANAIRSKEYDKKKREEEAEKELAIEKKRAEWKKLEEEYAKNPNMFDKSKEEVKNNNKSNNVNSGIKKYRIYFYKNDTTLLGKKKSTMKRCSYTVEAESQATAVIMFNAWCQNRYSMAGCKVVDENDEKQKGFWERNKHLFT